MYAGLRASTMSVVKVLRTNDPLAMLVKNNPYNNDVAHNAKMQGNNARWFKKEGDEVSVEDILCEVETDNATVAMECTEEVFLAKIIHGDGAKVIKVGEEDTEPVSSAEPKKPKVANAPQSGARIFASPLARKLANDHNHLVERASRTSYLQAQGQSNRSRNKLYRPSDFTNKKSCKVNSIHYKKLQTESGYRSMILMRTRKDCLKLLMRSNPLQKAKENSLKPEDYEGGTFTVSNLGGTYWDQAIRAIINPHTTGILAVGSVWGYFRTYGLSGWCSMRKTAGNALTEKGFRTLGSRIILTGECTRQSMNCYIGELCKEPRREPVI
ncbi:hypothetical protein Sjap_017916 [Stephania japonica]|uniref:Dihydrolipoamide acetyltransferase component of pyruvate dehydrogenase complex n=1 Tax=Stephania japonica TaxID=461633 RepID=A0AAP0NMK2_9MAGN